MTMNFILLATLIFILLMMRSMNMYTLKKNETYILFTNFPKGHDNDEFIVELLSKTKRKLNILFVTSIVLSLLLLMDSDLIMLIYYNLIIAYLIIANTIEYSAMKKIRQYKSDNNISTENHVLSYDLKTSRDIELKKIKPIAWIIPLIIQIVLLISFFKTTEMFLMYGLLLIIMSASTIITAIALSKKNTKVYSTDYIENLKINESSILKLQQTIYAIYIMSIILGFVVVFISSRDIYNLVPIFLYIVVQSTALIFTIIKYQKQERNYTAINNNLYNGDFYDPWGYYNPKDNRLLVEDITVKTGNMTFNRAKLSGKMIFALTIALLIGIEVFMINISFPKQFTVNNTQTTLSVRQSAYKTTIDKKSIEKVELIKNLNDKQGVRINGTSLKHYAYGKFSIKTIGNVDLYIDKRNPTAIWVKTKDNKNLVFNFSTVKETEKFYNLLKK